MQVGLAFARQRNQLSGVELQRIAVKMFFPVPNMLLLLFGQVTPSWRVIPHLTMAPVRAVHEYNRDGRLLNFPRLIQTVFLQHRVRATPVSLVEIYYSND